MTAYTPPSQEVLRASISRDLHDTDNRAFSTSEVNDLINGGIAELNRLVPKEARVDIPLVANTHTYDLSDTIDDIFRVELWRVGWSYNTLKRHDGDEMQSGWDYFNTILYLPPAMDFDADQDTLTVWGYSKRDPLLSDDEVLDADLDGENVIRAYAQFTCFQRLIMSRALFQQWQTDANNTDVSATQLLGMASVYANEWRSLRSRVRRLRRPS
jgi:hypothetical protein